MRDVLHQVFKQSLKSFHCRKNTYTTILPKDILISMFYQQKHNKRINAYLTTVISNLMRAQTLKMNQTFLTKIKSLKYFRTLGFKRLSQQSRKEHSSISRTTLYSIVCTVCVAFLCLRFCMALLSIALTSLVAQLLA